MLGFLRRDLHVDVPAARERVAGLLRDRGPLFLEAAFRHVSSDYYILSTVEEIDRVFAQFAGRGGGRTPLLISPARELARRGKVMFGGDTSHDGWEEAILALARDHTLVLLVDATGGAPAFHVLESDDDWEDLRRRIPAATSLMAFDAFHFGGRRSALTIWSGAAE